MMSKPRAHEKKEVFGFRILKVLFFLLPRPICLSLGRAFGNLVYHIARKHRQIALSNLNTAFGSRISGAKKKRIAKSAFKHFGGVFADIVKIQHVKLEKLKRFLSIEGTEHLEKALAQGKGVLIFSAHLGNWEIATALVSQSGKVNVVARPLDNRLLEKEIMQIRKKLGANVIAKQQAARPILRALMANEIVAILIDQNTVRNQAVFVDFFGKPAATTPSLAAFFLKTGAPILPVFCHPIRGGKYHVIIHQPLDIDVTGEEDQDILKITQLCTKIIQNQVQENPKVWLWFHNRWKTRPEEEVENGKEEHER
jgi:KDO2-lipid IV(A) lauroyltransferase